MSAILTDLKESTQGRSGTPDGNIFFDTTNWKMEIFFVDEVATIDYWSWPEANKLTAANRPTMDLLYRFEIDRRRANEDLQKFDPFIEANYKRAGAYAFVNNRSFATAGAEATKIDASWWKEVDTNWVIQKIYYGAISLGNIETTSQPYYSFADGVPIDFNRTWPVSESMQVFQEGWDDNRSVFNIAVRTFWYSFSSKSLADLPYDTTDADIGWFAIWEAEKIWITTAGYTIDNVYNTPVAPFDGMTFARLWTPATRTWFSWADKTFTDVLLNTGAGTVQEVMAKLDALASVDDNINTWTWNDGSVIRWKRNSEWYTVNASGQLVTKQGLFIDGLPVSESQKIIQTSDDGTACTYPYFPVVEISVWEFAKADSNAWYHLYYLNGTGDADFNKDWAVTVNDKDWNPVKWSVWGSDISFQYDYVGNTQAGLPADTDKVIVVEVAWDGIATRKKTIATIKKQDVNSISCECSEETNM